MNIKSKERKKYSKKFKKKIVDKVIRGEASVMELSRQYNIDYTYICRWKRELGQEVNKLQSFELFNAQRRISDLERLVGRLTLETELLKIKNE